MEFRNTRNEVMVRKTFNNDILNDFIYDEITETFDKEGRKQSNVFIKSIDGEKRVSYALRPTLIGNQYH